MTRRRVAVPRQQRWSKEAATRSALGAASPMPSTSTPNAARCSCSSCCCAWSTHCRSPHIHVRAAAALRALKCCTLPPSSATSTSPAPAPAVTDSTPASAVRTASTPPPPCCTTSSKPGAGDATTVTQRCSHCAAPTRHKSSTSPSQLLGEARCTAAASAMTRRRVAVPRQQRWATVAACTNACVAAKLVSAAAFAPVW